MAVAEYSCRAKHLESRISLAYPSGLAKGRSETGLTTSNSTTTTSHSGTVTTPSVILTKMNPWSRGFDTPDTSVTTVTSSSHSQSDSPVHEEVSLGPSSLLTSAGSGGWESEDEKEKASIEDQREPSNTQTTNEIFAPHVAITGGDSSGGGMVGVSVTPEPGSVDLNEEFPPLSKHSRSQSDPQVSSAERQQQQQEHEAQQDSKSGQTSLTVHSSRLTQSLTSSIQPEGSPSNYLKKPPLPPSLPSSFIPSVPALEDSLVSSESRDKMARSHRSASGPEKLPFASPAKRNQSDPAVLQGIKGVEDLEKTPGSRCGRSGSEDGLITSSKVPGSLAVGSDMEGKVCLALYISICL